MPKTKLKLYDIPCGTCVHYAQHEDTDFHRCGHPKLGRLMIVGSGDQPIYCPGSVKSETQQDTQ